MAKNIKDLWVWERAATLHLMYGGSQGCGKPLKEEYGIAAYPTLYGMFKDGMAKYICDPEVLVEKGKQAIQLFFKDKQEYDKRMKRWRDICQSFIQQFRHLDSTRLSELSNSELKHEYKAFDALFEEFWAVGEIAEPVSYGCESLLKNALTPEQVKKHFEALTSPTKPSYHSDEQKSLFAIIRLIRKNDQAQALFKKDIERIKAEIQEFEQISQSIKEHVKKYHWLQNNFYDTTYLKEEYFLKEIQKYIFDSINIDAIEQEAEKKLQEVKEKKKEAIQQLNLKESTQHIITLIDEFIFFQDHRKKIVLEANYYYDLFCKEAAQRANISYQKFRMTTPELLVKSLQGEDVNEEIEKLNHPTLLIITEEGNKIYTGEEAQTKEKELFGENEESQVTEIEGMCASVGKATGKVRKLLNPNEIAKMQEGEVLVTTMTSPDFVPAAKKASAIVTDEGGITCHAAIIARELGIPCVIGTKIATRELKDGDLIEVKANHGIVHVKKRT